VSIKILGRENRYNSWFIRNDLGGDVLPEVTSEECSRPPFARWASEKFLKEIKELGWVEV
jgi:hypothetical protein